MKSVLKTLLFGLLASAAPAAPFAAPTEAVTPFHRASLPIDADSMTRLASQLTILARGASMESPSLRRATAQGLALAIALDPGNQNARTSLLKISEGKSMASPEGDEVLRAKSQVWNMFGWLASPAAGGEGNLLADLLGDAVSVLDPGHPTAVSLRQSPERGKWDGWVAPVSSFREKEPVAAPPLAETVPEKPEVEPERSTAPGIKASTASIGAVLFVHDKDSEKYVLKPTAVRMEANPYGESDERRSGLRIDIRCPEGSEEIVRDDVSTPILDALGKLHGSRLPEGKVTILTGASDLYSPSRNGDDLTGPGLILGNAAITGIAPGATIIARLDEGGNLVLPRHFWVKMNALADGVGGRLIVPAEAEEYFTAMLTLEKSEFLFRFEVLIASTPAEAIALCAKDPDDNHMAVFSKFREIRDKSETVPLGSYLANHFVRQRLKEVTDAAPYHLSAKLFALQGAGERPRVLGRKILAAAVFQAIDGIREHSDQDGLELGVESAKSMENTYASVRAQLDALDRYTDIRDRDLISGGKAVASALRSLYRVIGGRGEMWEKYDEIAAAQKALRAANREFRAELSKITGDPLPEDVEARASERLRKRIRMRNR